MAAALHVLDTTEGGFFSVNKTHRVNGHVQFATSPQSLLSLGVGHSAPSNPTLGYH